MLIHLWPLGCDIRRYHPPAFLCALVAQLSARLCPRVSSLSPKVLGVPHSHALLPHLGPEAVSVAQCLITKSLKLHQIGIQIYLGCRGTCGVFEGYRIVGRNNGQWKGKYHERISLDQKSVYRYFLKLLGGPYLRSRRRVLGMREGMTLSSEAQWFRRWRAIWEKQKLSEQRESTALTTGVRKRLLAPQGQQSDRATEPKGARAIDSRARKPMGPLEGITGEEESKTSLPTKQVSEGFRCWDSDFCDSCDSSILNLRQ